MAEEAIEEMAARLRFEIDEEATGTDVIFLGAKAATAMEKAIGTVKVADPVTSSRRLVVLCGRGEVRRLHVKGRRYQFHADECAGDLTSYDLAGLGAMEKPEFRTK